MADETLSVLLALRADITDLKAKFGQVETSAKVSASKMQSAFKGIALGLGAIGTAMMVFKRGQALMQGAIQAAQRQEQAHKKLQSALGYTSTLLLQQASALQATTTFGDEAVVEAQAMVGAFIKEENQIKRLMPVILDFAAAKGIDLKSAADLVTKSIASGTNALARYGIKITDSKDRGERLESTIKGLEKAYGGMSVALAQTPSGILEQQKNLLDDMAESVGNELIPWQIEWNKLLLETLQGWGWIYTQVKKLFSWNDAAERRNLEWHEQMRDAAFARANGYGAAVTAAKKLQSEGATQIQIEVDGKKEILRADEAIAKLERERRIALRTAGGEARMVGAAIGGAPPVKGAGKHVASEIDMEARAAAAAKAEQQRLAVVSAEIQADLSTYVNEINIAFAEIDKLYAENEINVKAYYESKRLYIVNQSEAEIAAMKETAKMETDAAKSITASMEIDKAKAALKVKLIELAKEENAAVTANSEKLQENATANAELLSVIQRRVNDASIESYQDKLDAELLALKQKHEEEIRMLTEHGAAVEQIKAAERMQTQERVLAEQQAQVAYLNNSLSAVNDIVGQISSIYDGYYEMVVAQEQQKMSAQIASAQAAGASEAQLEALRKSLSAQANARAKKAWEKQKKADLASAIIGTALAVVNALQTKPFYLGLIMAVLAGVAGGVQIAKIAQQSYPGMATGGLVEQGSTATADDVHARLSRGEYVTPAKSVSYYGAGVMEAMRKRTVPKELFSGIGSASVRRPSSLSFAEGGLVPAAPGTTEQQVTVVNFVDPNLLEKYINSIEGERAIVNVINRRSYEVNRALGG